MRTALAVLTSLVLLSCGDEAAVFDGGSDDAGPEQRASIDAGAPDAGVTSFDAGFDAGVLDAGRSDAGLDAGRPDAGFDAGFDAGGVLDAGSPDAGLDAGNIFDAGRPDAGFDAGAGVADAGFDAGVVDAGFDAGVVDAGFDAGVVDAGFDAGVADAGPCNQTCPSGQVCEVSSGTCQTCGIQGWYCCDQADPCATGMTCQTRSLSTQGLCGPPNTFCGGSTGWCCALPDGAMECGPGSISRDGGAGACFCQGCGDYAQPCCAGSLCNPGFFCNSSQVCQQLPCGIAGLACCVSGGASCTNGTSCDAGICQNPNLNVDAGTPVDAGVVDAGFDAGTGTGACGAIGQACCTNTATPCTRDYLSRCSNGTCIACGGNNQPRCACGNAYQPCCAGNFCNSGRECIVGFGLPYCSLNACGGNGEPCCYGGTCPRSANHLCQAGVVTCR
jgi:hypothetical protein